MKKEKKEEVPLRSAYIANASTQRVPHLPSVEVKQTIERSSSIVDLLKEGGKEGSDSFLFAEGVKPVEIIRRMKERYNDSCLSRSKIYKRIERFKQIHRFRTPKTRDSPHLTVLLKKAGPISPKNSNPHEDAENSDKYSTFFHQQ
ncbi:hypothetical protein TNCV_2374891 [Trichonephila clavipes]|nr:hypothetical protein TNCV_2374891 [Trichonephila clavipes]